MKRLPLFATALLAVGAGCTEPREEPITVGHPQIHWEELASAPVQEVEDGFVNLAPGGTDGLFPAAIAVARITAVEENAGDQVRRVRLDMTPANDFLPWNGLFDSLRYISEVFPMHWHDLGEDDPSPARLAAAAGELRAALCLVYGRSDLSATESEVRGVLYNTQTGLPLGVMHARVAIPQPQDIERPPEYARGDERHCDARYLADARFERLVLECVRDLRRGDRPVVAEPPEGWTPAQPLWPRVWPPTPFDQP